MHGLRTVKLQELLLTAKTQKKTIRKYASEEALEVLDRRTINGTIEDIDSAEDDDDSVSTISDFYEGTSRQKK